MKILSQQDYQKSLLTKASLISTFQALTQQISKWWTEDFRGKSLNINDEFTVYFGETFMTFKIVELITNKKIVWLCTDTLANTEELSNDTEWKNTKIIWELQHDDEATTITLTHIGLTPEVKCYNICKQGWESFLYSLKQFTETNRGLPFKMN
jgi:hypothetical protein